MIAAVIPARNEAGAIADVVTGVCVHVDEVIVVDDGSSDDTAVRAREAGAKIVTLDGRGKGYGLRAGVASTRAQTLVLLDGDGQDDPADVPALLARIDAGAELVIGSRFAGRPDPGAIAPLDRVGNRMLTGVLNQLYGRPQISDTQAGFRAVTRALWDRLELRADGFDIETEVLVRALQAGARIDEVPVRRRRRTSGTRVLRRGRDGLAILGCMLRLRLQS